MAAEDSELERTEPASQRRLDDAREQGNIARSPELSAFAVTISALGALWFTGEGLMQGLKNIMIQGLTLDSATVHEPGRMLERLFSLSTHALVIGGPLLAITVLAAVVTPMAVGGWSFAPAALAPKFERISPMKGIGRMFSTHGLGELGKALLKAGLVGAVACIVLWNAKESMLEL